ncbi:sushi, von Willebrand factor type A, EGF and pentraxin domain-containing protein 1-like [Anopheles funestus]|uniref:sushi, von Willebrand factor type A, EGF and pentraxin domain-containing protein 1-like n=1 Tax=Anopheles funestus TaxID=62324 RepID=UPI0020C6D7AA|nr:sushi, von Willebrand factor type A, EGF and pentraxin domain-containing protein 1-like [Anopheles funestus]
MQRLLVMYRLVLSVAIIVLLLLVNGQETSDTTEQLTETSTGWYDEDASTIPEKEYQDLDLGGTTQDINQESSAITQDPDQSRHPQQTTSATVRRLELANSRFQDNINSMKNSSARLDIVFLIDASSSVGPSNFQSELRFVKKLLAGFDVSMNRTRIAVVTFSSRKKVIRHVDQVSRPVPDNNKCLLLNYQLPGIEYSGGGTYTYGALKEAEDIFADSRRSETHPDGLERIIFLITDGYSNGQSPIPIAQRLKRSGVKIFTIGIETGNDEELASIVTSTEHRYLLSSFEQFETLVRQALHLDYRHGPSVPVANGSLCDRLCDKMKLRDPNGTALYGCCDEHASCTCLTSSGHYRCTCQRGFSGSGLRGDCHPCPNGTYWIAGGICESCPHARHITLTLGATSEKECVCPHGYQENEDGRCVAITCSELQAPENGYFVMEPKPCSQVLNAACGTRCRPGYELTGSSIRLCQENGEWSGIEAKCTMKICPPLNIPYYGMTVCSNPDLDLLYDYTPRNKSFLQNYSMSSERFTEAMPIDTECSFTCGPGFYLKGSHNRNCLPLSKWDGLQTTCKQILCPALPKVAFGTYDPTDCAESKSAFGTNCTLICDFGFEMKGGPSTKQCGGKRTGTWSKMKTPRCIDIAPPYIECPGNYTVLMDDDYPYAIVRRLQQPYVFDNSGDNYTYWSKPGIKEEGIRLALGDHEFSYIAMDAFKNKARCSFTVTVIDLTPPVFEHCLDGPVHYVSDINNPQETFVRWEEPLVYDNAGRNITITQNVTFGYLPAGKHWVQYHAVDPSGNKAECVLTVQVRQYNCDDIPEPRDGYSICAYNNSHVWCEIGCKEDYMFSLQPEETIRMVCDRAKPTWGEQMDVPECSKVISSTGVEKIITIRLDNEMDPTLCNDTDAINEVSEAFNDGLREELCGNQEDCTLMTTLPTCVHSKTTSQTDADESLRYSIVKRSVESQGYSTPDPVPANDRAMVKIFVYKRVSQELGLWRSDGKQSENIKRIKEELEKINGKKKLRRRLGALNLDLSVLKLDEKIRCANGSISKKLVCVHCPRGTYHNYTINTCVSCPISSYNDQTGQTACQQCPEHHSTRKLNAKHAHECKPQCPPGTVARLKLLKKTKPNGGAAGTVKYHKTLMPFCRLCEPGQYQEQYNRAQCHPCPSNHSSPRGSKSPSDCFPIGGQLCNESVSNVCGTFGRCVTEPFSPLGYRCVCEDNYVGEHCEIALNPCGSAPCFNGGRCVTANSSAGFVCYCEPPYSGGPLCEFYVDPCRSDYCLNGGSCVEADGRPFCECPLGYEGERCEWRKDFCTPNPCEYRGVCVNVDEGYSCACPRGKTGRRCHLEPCDYLPCPAGALCLNGPNDTDNSHDKFVVVLQTQQKQPQRTTLGESLDYSMSYMCVCPIGLRGNNCTQIDNPCDKVQRHYCRNGGTCEPVKLRILTESTAEDYDDESYRSVRCHCPPGYHGSRCDLLLSAAFEFDFPRSGVHAYAKLPARRIEGEDALKAIGMCGWYRTDDDFNYGTLLSYATANSDNAFTLTDYSGLVLYVNGAHVVTNVSLNDGDWHFVCVSWTSAGGRYALYLDGELSAEGWNLSDGVPIQPGGLYVFGQEQDVLGGGFSETESYRGRMAYVDLWSRPLEAGEVKHFYRTCEPYGGNMIRWLDLRLQTVGQVRIVSSGFCRDCPRNHSLPNGSVRYEGMRARFRCNEGYELIGSSIAECLRTSQWTAGVQFCKLIRCGTLNAPLNGHVILSKTSYGGEARFGCDEGFLIAGSDILYCTARGTWSGTVPECISIVKCPPLVLEENDGRAPIIYATERGAITRSLPSYDVGVLAEVRCLPQFALTDDNLLTCLETGQWDIPLPECVPIPPTTTPAGDSHSNLIIRVNRRPDVQFWKHLRDYLFHGCTPSTIPGRQLSLFCYSASGTIAGNNWTDLSGFTLQKDAPRVSNIDVKLLGFLMRTVQPKPVDKLVPENLLHYILYGTVEPIPPAMRYPAHLENAYRFVICQFIDIILMDRELNYDDELVVDIRQEENTNTKIKHLLKNVAQVVYQQYQHLLEERNARESAALKKIIELAEAVPVGTSSSITTSTTTTTTTATTPKSCPLSHLPTPPIDSHVVMVAFRTLIHRHPDEWRYEKLLYSGQNAEPGDRIEYGCDAGFSMRGSGVTECDTSGRWNVVEGFCEGAVCENPPNRPNMLIAPESLDKQYYVDDEIEYRCEAGYTLKGHPIVKCQPNGRWTLMLARCTRISCGRPKNLAMGHVIAGNTFLYGDSLTLRCKDHTLAIICQSNGQWTPFNECF